MAADSTGRAASGRLSPAAARGIALALAALAALSCARSDSGGAPPPGDAGPITACDALSLDGEPRARSLVLILADTLRRDRVGAYGGPAHTPHFDAFAKENLLFTRAATQSPWTKPAMATLFTGQYPARHGVISHPMLRRGADGREVLASDRLPEQTVTLAEILADAGYRTAGFVSNPWMQKELGFAQGFETYDDSFAANDTPGSVVSEAGLRWLREASGDDRPWLLYLHYMDPHGPYLPVGRERMREELPDLQADDRPVPRHAARQIARMARAPGGGSWARAGVPPNLALMELVYDQGVERFDGALGAFLEGLAELPVAEDAAVWIVSDHGEALFHRGWREHGHGLYGDETAAVMAARLPGVAADGPVPCPLGLVDIRATLCDYLGLSCPGPDEGLSLFAETGEHYLRIEGVKGKRRNRAILSGRYKLIARGDGPPPRAVPAASRRHSLYDLVRDPEEQHDLLAEGEPTPEVRRVFERLRRELAAAPVAPRPGDREADGHVELDDRTRQRLEALGYMDPEAPATEE